MLTKRKLCSALLVGAASASTLPLAFAHGSRKGDLRIDHPYAVPSAAGKDYSSAFFRGIENTGDAPDSLVGASSPVAARVGLYHMAVQDGVMRMQEVTAIALPPNATTPMRHNLGDYHLMFLGLKKPLKNGDRVALTLTFARAGTQTVNVWVQTPKLADDAHAH